LRGISFAFLATKGRGAPGFPVDDLKKFFKLGRTETLRPSGETRFRDENKENGRGKIANVV
jgi:hypothetical protein